MNTNNNKFIEFANKYKQALTNYLNDKSISENHLSLAYQLGRESVADDLGMLNVVAIYHDSLIEYIEQCEINSYVDITDKASIFLQETLASYQMMTKGFQEAIDLINKNIVDFTSRIQALKDSEAQLKLLAAKQESSLKEKESLLKEVYHRVKNNLQVITSLISLQVESILDMSAKNILIECEARIKSMALIHEMLYQSENLAKIEMPAYINNLLRYLIDAYTIDTNKIKLSTDIDEISLTIDCAIPCGLIINELVSNAIKHGFPFKQQGDINVSLKNIENKNVLTVANSGVALPDTFDMNSMNTLGMRLINSLSKQINGSITLHKQPITSFAITFMNGIK